MMTVKCRPSRHNPTAYSILNPDHSTLKQPQHPKHRQNIQDGLQVSHARSPSSIRLRTSMYTANTTPASTLLAVTPPATTADPTPRLVLAIRASVPDVPLRTRLLAVVAGEPGIHSLPSLVAFVIKLQFADLHQHITCPFGPRSCGDNCTSCSTPGSCSCKSCKCSNCANKQ
jgi:hypothetical protein